MQRTETVQATEAVGAGRRSPGLDLFLISFLSLYLELLVIRWLASEIRIFAYFKNVPLMASLFGLGLGMALAGRRFNLTPYFPISFLAVAALISLAEPLGLVHVTFLDPLEHQLLGGVGLSHMEASSLASYLGKGIFGLFVLVAVFYLIVIMFMSIGQELGRLFDRFRPLSAYSINVGGAILGIALFSAMSFLCYPPYVWVGTAAVLSLWFYRRPHHWVVLAAAVAIVLATQQAHIHWSPYYRISVSPALIHGDKGDKPHRYGYQINVNHDAMEGAYDNSPLALVALSDSQRKKVLDFYEMVYAVLGDGPRSVLILAAGLATMRHLPCGTVPGA